MPNIEPHLDESSTELRVSCLRALLQSNPLEKVKAVQAIDQARLAGTLAIDPESEIVQTFANPGRPDVPILVPPLEVERRSMRTPEGRAALIHALAHIEFNAINLALDAVWRFAGMPSQYYLDWLKVAFEEAYHFSLLDAHLQTLGFRYGDFNAHNSLWDMAAKTSGDLLARMALVPRTLEARGLDATPGVRAKLAQAGDTAAAEILDIILRDEIGHVAIGNLWFSYLCKANNFDPIDTYVDLSKKYRAPPLRGPFNLEARRAAGFSEEEMMHLESLMAAAKS